MTVNGNFFTVFILKIDMTVDKPFSIISDGKSVNVKKLLFNDYIPTGVININDNFFFNDSYDC